MLEINFPGLCSQRVALWVSRWRRGGRRRLSSSPCSDRRASPSTWCLWSGSGWTQEPPPLFRSSSHLTPNLPSGSGPSQLRCDDGPVALRATCRRLQSLRRSFHPEQRRRPSGATTRRGGGGGRGSLASCRRGVPHVGAAAARRLCEDADGQRRLAEHAKVRRGAVPVPITWWQP